MNGVGEQSGYQQKGYDPTGDSNAFGPRPVMLDAELDIINGLVRTYVE
jgi:hypothetical protein